VDLLFRAKLPDAASRKEVAIFVPVLAIAALIAGSGLAIALYRNRASEPVDLELLRHKFYFDEFYSSLIHWTQELLAHVSAFVDRWIIDAGAVAEAVASLGHRRSLALVQVGNLQAYVFLFGLGSLLSSTSPFPLLKFWPTKHTK